MLLNVVQGPGFNPEDILRDFFGMGGRGGGGFSSGFGFGGNENGPSQGADLQTSIHISFMEAVNGTTKTVQIAVENACSTCSGSGGKPGTTPTKCGTCNGTGQQTMSQGFFRMQMPCQKCHGQGKTQPPCTTCSGQGTIRERKTVSVPIPAGVESGSNIRLSGQGNAGRLGGSRGSLYVQISVGSHPTFKREGYDVHVDVPISMTQATLGGAVNVPTLSGEAILKIEPGTQPGERKKNITSNLHKLVFYTMLY